jgi:hypothetical protein
MLVIRDQQMQVFAESARRQFEAEMILHLSKFAPSRFETLGEKAVGETVSLGIERAEKHAFTNRGPVRFYIELMLLLGDDFDTDSRYAWAAEALADPETAEQMSQADQASQTGQMSQAAQISLAAQKSRAEQMRRANQMGRADWLHKKMIQFIETSATQEGEYDKGPLNHLPGASPVATRVSFENIPANPCAAVDSRTPVSQTTAARPDEEVPEKAGNHEHS